MATKLIDKPTFDLTGWEYLLTFGGKLDVYGRGTERVMIDLEGKVVAEYEVGGK